MILAGRLEMLNLLYKVIATPRLDSRGALEHLYTAINNGESCFLSGQDFRECSNLIGFPKPDGSITFFNLVAWESCFLDRSTSPIIRDPQTGEVRFNFIDPYLGKNNSQFKECLQQPLFFRKTWMGWKPDSVEFKAFDNPERAGLIFSDRNRLHMIQEGAVLIADYDPATEKVKKSIVMDLDHQLLHEPKDLDPLTLESIINSDYCLPTLGLILLSTIGIGGVMVYHVLYPEASRFPMDVGSNYFDQCETFEQEIMGNGMSDVVQPQIYMPKAVLETADYIANNCFCAIFGRSSAGETGSSLVSTVCHYLGLRGDPQHYAGPIERIPTWEAVDYLKAYYPMLGNRMPFFVDSYIRRFVPDADPHEFLRQIMKINTEDDLASFRQWVNGL